MPSMTERVCANKRCGKTFSARTADVKRGWAKFCSKSCKAVKQEQRTGQYKALLSSGGANPKGMQEWEVRQIEHEQAMEDSTSCHGQDVGDW